jgi:signal transduction histidine kinase
LRVANGDGFVHLAVTDNGIGFAPEIRQRLFQHGFTTKEDGHGFGLHSAVVAARELGGAIEAQSDGPGTGATFTLKLPLAAPAPPTP